MVESYHAYGPAEVRAEPRFTNVCDVVRRGRKRWISEEQLFAVVEVVTMGAKTLGQVEAALVRWAPARTLVFAAALRGRVKLDLSRPLSAETAVLL